MTTAATSSRTRMLSQVPSTRQRVRLDIQGLRAFAVIVVVADHLFHWPSGGFVGVDVFFVLSGFLITSLLLRELDHTGRISITRFYRRRVRRIIPAATAVITATVLFAAFVLPRPRAASVATDGLASFFFVENWRALSVGTDYFKIGTLPSPLQHFWSLSVEEQFYLAWPLITAAAFAWASHRWGRSGVRGLVSIVFGVFVVGSFGWAMVESTAAPSTAYFSTLSRAWELGVGAMLAAVGLERLRWHPSVRAAFGWLGLIALLVSIFVITPQTPFPGPWALLPVLATGVVVAAGSGAEGDHDRAMWPLTNRVAEYVGAISYSLYLWHLPVIVLLAAFLPQDSGRYLMLALLLTVVLSIVSYHLIEQPVRRSRWLKPNHSSSRLQRFGGVQMIMGLAAVAFFGVVTTGRLAIPPPTEARAPTIVMASCAGAAAMLEDCRPADSPVTADEVTPSLDALANDTAGGYSCWRAQGADFRSCTYGSKEADAARVAVVGDSHAAAMLPAVLSIAEPANWRVDTYTGYGCQWRDQADGSDCDEVIDEVQRHLLNGGYDLVLTTAARWANDAATLDSFTRYLKPVADTGAQVVVVAAAPQVPEETIACINRIGVDLAQCGASRTEAFAIPDRLAEAAERLDIPIVDLSDLYCDEQRCPAFVGGVIVARDAAGHVTGTYMKTLAPYLLERVREATGVPAERRQS